MLDQQQTKLLEAIFLDNSLFNHSSENDVKNKGLKIYQHSLIANAARALSITFATVHSYLGKNTFDAIVKKYLKAELKQEYDWGEFGSSLSSFIAKQDIENAYLLSQLAELDFFCHQSERSKDIPVDLTTLNLLSEHDAYELYISFCSGINVMQSILPLDEINNTITQLTEEQKINSLADVTQKLTEFSTRYNPADNKSETLYNFIIWRPDFQAQYTRISTEEYLWFNTLLDKDLTSKTSIGQALDDLNETDFSFVEWLPKAIQERLINGITLQK
ncbi:putative DNA-binding domain-containing protein [Pseudocolwellia sp. HL-MZ19]|uniref:HvfC/BufC family peptide modification chaperone n=1 Tax=unclassified Pseudocolwellia TaxID=2848178 RepID=UPI003CFA4180